MKYRISVLIAAYNIKDYIKECLDSIFSQSDLNDVEVVAIDNKSNDGTEKILDEYAAKHSILKVFHLKNNVGLFLSRHTAMQLAKGDYFVFVDGDDTLNIDAIKRLKEDINAFSPTFIIYRYRKFGDATGDSKNFLEISKSKLCTSEEINKFKYIFASSNELNNIWIKAVRRNALANFDDYQSYKDYKYAEDRLNSIFLFSNDDLKIVYEPNVLYNYRIRNTSITKTYAFDRFYQHHNMNILLYEKIVKSSTLSKKEQNVIAKNRKKDEIKTLIKCLNKESARDDKVLQMLHNVSEHYKKFVFFKDIKAGLLYDRCYKKMMHMKYRSISKLNSIYRVLKHGK